MTNLPEDAMDPQAPPGTPPAAGAAGQLAPFFCAHGVSWHFHAIKGGYLPDVAEPDVLHTKLVLRSPGDLHDECQPARAADPEKYPAAWPDGVKEIGS